LENVDEREHIAGDVPVELHVGELVELEGVRKIESGVPQLALGKLFRADVLVVSTDGFGRLFAAAERRHLPGETAVSLDQALLNIV